MSKHASQLYMACFAAVLAGILGIAASEIQSFDIFWQLQSGRYIVNTGEFLYRDTFSLAADVARYEHCWLHDVVFYTIFRHFGYEGISLAKGTLVALTILFLGLTARLRGSSWPVFLLLLPFLVAQTHFLWRARPQLWTFLFFALFLWLYERYRTQPWKLAGAMIVAMGIWANMHAGAILAFPLLLALAAGEGLDHLTARSESLPAGGCRMWPVLFIGVAVAGLMTPYGGQLFEALLRTPTVGAEAVHAFNVDWRATSYDRFPYFYWAFAFSVLLFLVNRRGFLFRDLFLIAGLFLMGWKFERHTPFLLFALAVLLPMYLSQLLASLTQHFRWLRQGLLAATLLVLALAANGYYGHLLAQRYGLFRTGVSSWVYPHQAADFLKQAKLPGNLFNSYDIGGYLMWALFPDYQVFWDGRHSSAEMFDQGLSIMHAREGWSEILERFRVNIIIIEPLRFIDGGRHPLVDELLDDSDWPVIYADDSFLIFVRRSAVDPVWLSKARLSRRAAEETILSRARHLVQAFPSREKAFLEAARVLVDRRDYRRAERALGNYFSRTSREEWDSRAVLLQRTLQKSLGRH